ncbi:MAG: hypothetical protein U1E76_13000 [Planctomycetota bacterium]
MAPAVAQAACAAARASSAPSRHQLLWPHLAGGSQAAPASPGAGGGTLAARTACRRSPCRRKRSRRRGGAWPRVARRGQGDAGGRASGGTAAGTGGVPGATGTAPVFSAADVERAPVRKACPLPPYPAWRERASCRAW